MGMKYKYLADIREGIPYRKSLRKHVGSIAATILIQQLDFHFADYPDGIYKFLAPTPGHPDYREGDSWVEELAFSEKEFRAAFDQLGVRHTSKTAYLQADNPFINEQGEEKYYCSYHDKQKGLTWYFRNHDKVDDLIEQLIKIDAPKASKRPTSKESTVTAQRESTVTAQRSSTVTAQRESTVDDLWEPCNLPLGSYVTAQRSSTFIYKENTKNTNKEEDPPTSQGENLGAVENGTAIVRRSLSEEEYEILRQAQNLSYNPSIAPWRINATEFSSEVCKAVFAANPEWYSLEDGTTNLKKIKDRLKTLERNIRNSNCVTALEAYTQLMDYVHMGSMSSSGINGKQILQKVNQESEMQRIHNASQKGFEL